MEFNTIYTKSPKFQIFNSYNPLQSIYTSVQIFKLWTIPDSQNRKTFFFMQSRDIKTILIVLLSFHVLIKGKPTSEQTSDVALRCLRVRDVTIQCFSLSIGLENVGNDRDNVKVSGSWSNVVWREIWENSGG